MSEHRVCLYKVNRELRQYRFYSLSVQPNLFGTWSLIREWGRIGCAGRERIEWHETELDARRVMSRKMREKRRRGYYP
jgi:predicted DNA-binding WGR domain protein